MRICEQCGNSVTSTQKTVRFCSPRCWYDSQTKKRIQKICEVCGTIFLTLNERACTCGRECYLIFLRNRFQAANPNWKGDAIVSSTGNDRARRWYPKTLPCEVCAEPSERHHKDGNPKNNKRSNIAFLCRKHHMEADGRLEKVKEMIKRAQPKAALAAGIFQRSKTLCKRGHLLSGDNLEIRDDGYRLPWRVCKTCRRIRNRLAVRKKFGFNPHPKNVQDEKEFLGQ